jgi:hypothetical protein
MLCTSHAEERSTRGPRGGESGKGSVQYRESVCGTARCKVSVACPAVWGGLAERLNKAIHTGCWMRTSEIVSSTSFGE